MRSQRWRLYYYVLTMTSTLTYTLRSWKGGKRKEIEFELVCWWTWKWGQRDPSYLLSFFCEANIEWDPVDVELIVTGKGGGVGGISFTIWPSHFINCWRWWGFNWHDKGSSLPIVIYEPDHWKRNAPFLRLTGELNRIETRSGTFYGDGFKSVTPQTNNSQRPTKACFRPISLVSTMPSFELNWPEALTKLKEKEDDTSQRIVFHLMVHWVSCSKTKTGRRFK